MEDIKTGKVLIDFGATWCGHCVSMKPIVDEVASEVTDVKVVKIDIDENMELARQFKVSSIPAFVLLQDGELQGKKVGAMSKEELVNFITKK